MADTRVVLFALGGTIAMASDGRGGVVPALSAAQLVAAVPGLEGCGIDVEVEDFRRLPGASLRFDDLAALAAAIDDRLASGADGVVVTQGTDTIEESAYYLDLVHQRPEPVVVTGAMRNPMLAGPDGPANLLAAVRVAANRRARGQGCLVVMADEIHAARWVRKTHAASVATFRSPTSGPVGHFVGDTPSFVNRIDHRLVVPPLPDGQGSARVALVVTALGDDGDLLEGLSERFDGLVVAGFGVGHVPEALVERLHMLAEEMPVVLTSRTGSGPVFLSVYSFPGSESDLLERGLVPAGFVDPFKARVLLHVLLASGCDRATISDAFLAAGGYRDPSDWPWASI